MSPVGCRWRMFRSSSKNASDTPDSVMRAELLNDLATALESSTFVKLTLSKPKRGARDTTPTQAFVRRVDLRRGPHVSILLRYTNRDVTRNCPLADAATEIGSLLD